MFGNNFNNFGNGYTMPTATQPYGYPMNNFAPQTQMQQPQQTQVSTNTNKVYVNGIEDVRNRPLPPNSDFIFLDNDKPILYQKIVNGNGQFEVKAFNISPYEPQESQKQESPMYLSGYVKLTDLEPIKNEIKAIKEKLVTKKVEVINGTGTNTTYIGTKSV